MMRIALLAAFTAVVELAQAGLWASQQARKLLQYNINVL